LVSARDHIILQGIVLLWGLTAVLGKMITLPPETLVVWRTGIAAAALILWFLVRGKRPAFGLWERRALANGTLIGLHWYLFFLAARVGNVSTMLTGIATLALWVALLEPLIIKDRRLHFSECLLALAVTGGVALVAGSDDVSLPCLGLGVLAAAVAAVFSIFNARIVRHVPAITMTLYEMVSASLFCAVLSVATGGADRWLPALSDWVPLLTLALLCTVCAFSVCVWLQRRVPPFTIGIAGNLEPIYGMILAAAVFGSSEVMGLRFYAGAAIIIGCVVWHTAMLHYSGGPPEKKATANRREPERSEDSRTQTGEQ
jgi:drug/metabolite transporter (DMT)-like permease